MYFRYYFNFILIVLVFVSSCVRNEEKPSPHSQQDEKQIHVKYAKHFGIRKTKNNNTIIFITENYKDTLFFEVEKNFSRIAALGTIPTFQLSLLNSLQSIVAIDDIKYYHHPEIKKIYQSGKIAEILPNLQWNYELLIQSKPDVLISYSEFKDNLKIQEILQKNHIKHLIYLDYLEQHPLARAEWIKVLACLVHKDSLGEKIFSEIEAKYLKLKKLTDSTSYRPTVFTEIMYGDVWYIAGNKSYIAQLINDAGGKYIFDFHEYENSKPFSFEYVLKYAQNADFWIHLHQFQSLKEIKNTNFRYTLFKAFQKKNCYNNNKIKNEYGYNDYYESGICLPHLILEDLIKILHPSYLPQKELLYYYQLK